MPIRGHIDRCDPHLIEGWIVWSHDPLTRVEIEVVYLGVVIAQAVADRFRSDVRNAGFGDGYCSFSLRTPPVIAGRDLSRVMIRPKGVNAYLVQPGYRDPEATERVGDVVPVPVARVEPEPPKPNFWIDREDWFETLCARHRRGEMTDEVADDLCRFARDGILVLRRAVSPFLMDMAERSLAAARQAPPEGLHIARRTAGEGYEVLPASGVPLEETAILIDPHAYSSSVRALQAAPAGVALLRAILGQPPLIYESHAPVSACLAAQATSDLDGAVIGCFLTLQPLDEERGTIAYRHGSHRRDRESDQTDAHPVRSLKADPGTLVIWHPHLEWLGNDDPEWGRTGSVVYSRVAPAGAAEKLAVQDFPVHESHGCHFVSRFHRISALL